jgi:hypothetical protein
LILSIDAEKAFAKIQQYFMVKTLGKLGTEGLYLSIKNAICDKDIVNIILNLGKLKPFLLNSGIRKRYPLYST